MILTKVSVVGLKCFNTFAMNNGKSKTVEISPREYDSLATAAASIIGGKWSHSFARHKYDTFDGDLHDGQYADNDATYFSVKIAGTPQFSVLRKRIVSNNFLP